MTYRNHASLGTVATSRDGEPFLPREWDSVLQPSKSTPGHHGLNFLLDCEYLTSREKDLRHSERNFLSYLIQARVKTDRFAAGGLSVHLTDSQVTEFKALCRRFDMLKTAKETDQ